MLAEMNSVITDNVVAVLHFLVANGLALLEPEAVSGNTVFTCLCICQVTKHKQPSSAVSSPPVTQPASTSANTRGSDVTASPAQWRANLRKSGSSGAGSDVTDSSAANELTRSTVSSITAVKKSTDSSVCHLV